MTTIVDPAQAVPKVAEAPVERERVGRAELKALSTLVPYLWPSAAISLRGRVALAISLLIAAKVANVNVPLLYKGAIDTLTSATGEGALAHAIEVPIALLIGYGLLRVTASAFAELRDAVFSKVGQRAIRNLGLATFRHLHGLSLRFHLERQTGGLSRAIERGTKGIDSLLSYLLFSILPTLVEILLVCGILWGLYDIWFALLTFVTISCYIAWTLTVTEWRIKFRRQMIETDEEAHTRAIDSLLNYETVKYFSNEAHESQRFDSALQRYERAAVTSQQSLSLLNIGQGAIIATGVTLVMIMAGNGIVAGRMSIGDFVLVNSYLIQLYMPLNFLGYVYREIKQSLLDMEKMFRILDVPREVEDRPGAPAIAVSQGRIEFRHVDFSYEQNRQILFDVSFEVPPGKTVAIVGPSGAGKSTISRILFRFYDVASGEVQIDGQDIRLVSQSSLRKAIGIVPQDTVLFNDTIYYNIAYGRPEATRAEVEEAAKLAQIHDFVVSLPAGYATMVGERGLKLSGGEKQRVAIARTLLKRPSVFLFDEATSALDSHTEKEIQASLRAVSANRTTLIIAHRLSTVIDADEIIVLQAGRVVERGRHQQLLAEGGHYAAMWRKQQERVTEREDARPAA
ncbi:MAG: ABC transporter ATP-binding protein/permease [Proteobacteria bacterium]|nr:ABC transporter ATP-binding protein/permease [Pseudomonadota bacterium]MBI3497329.1 ABC transporter ATP-binding protein/permease [Pseudomonadota bacterium]